MVMIIHFIFDCSSTYKPIVKRVVLPDVTDLHYIIAVLLAGLMPSALAAPVETQNLVQRGDTWWL